jgi:protein-arginine kinase
MQELTSGEEWQVAEMEYDDDSSDFNNFNTYVSKENRLVVVKTIEGSIIRGNINLNSESLPMDRVSDLLIKGQNKFLIMYNASLGDRKDAAVIINKSQIVWVMEEEGTQRKS